MSDVSLDYAGMNDLLGNLIALRDELASAGDSADDVADATGHDRLGNVIREFADGWRIRRGELKQMVEDTRVQGNAILQGLQALDAEMS